MDFWGQRAVRGQAVLTPLMREGVFPNGNTIINVEDGCASGSVAFNGAWSAIRQGADLALALGVEKMHDSTRSGSRSEEHTSELQSLMRISYAVFCLKKKTTTKY